MSDEREDSLEGDPRLTEMKFLQLPLLCQTLYSIIQICEEVPLVPVLSSSEPKQVKYSQVIKFAQRAHRGVVQQV